MSDVDSADSSAQQPTSQVELVFVEPLRAKNSPLAALDVRFYLDNRVLYADMEKLMFSSGAYLGAVWDCYPHIRPIQDRDGGEHYAKQKVQKITRLQLSSDHLDYIKIRKFMAVLDDYIQNSGDARIEAALKNLQICIPYIETHQSVQYSDIQQGRDMFYKIALVLQEFRLEVSSVLGAYWRELHHQ